MDTVNASGGDIFAKKKWMGRLILFGIGVIAGLGHAPFDLWLIGLVGFTAVIYVMGEGGFWRAWWIGFGYFALTLHWIVEPFLVDVARHGWMAPFAVVLMSGGLALFWGLAGWGAVRLAPNQARRSLWFVLALIVAEYGRASVFTGFPWALPSYILTASPVLPVAAVWGPFGATALMLGACAGIVLIVRHSVGVGCALAGLCSACLVVPLVGLDAASDESSPIIRLVQPNAPQDEKWKPGKAREFLDRQLGFTKQDPRPDLVIWPETSVAFNFADVVGVIDPIAGGVPVIFGAQRRSEGRFFNSLIFSKGPSVQHVYDKSHLVPFGEYIPFGNLLGRFGIHGLADTDGSGFAAGADPKLLSVDGIGAVWPAICYESIFPYHFHQNGMRARMLLVATNDAWFGKFAGPQQHLAQSRWRAAEQGIPLVRVANTGISAMIDPRGRIIDKIDLGQAGFIDVALPAVAEAHLYAGWGRWLDTSLIVLCLLGLFTLRRHKAD